MAIEPTLPRAGFPGSAFGSSNAKSRTAKAASSDERAARAAQSELSDRANEIKNQIRTVDREGQAAVEALKTNYEKEALAESSRTETSLESEKLKGYEKIRDLQRAQAAELARVKRQGESDLAEMNEHYRNQTYSTDKNHNEQLTDLQMRHQRQLDFERTSGTALTDQVRHEQKMELDRIRTESDENISKAENQAHTLFEKKRTLTNEAIESASKNLESRYADASQTHQQILNSLQSESSRQLKQARLDTSRKLAAYTERQEDPFYQMMDTKAEFRDEGDRYTLTAQIPQHEQDHVSVAIRGNQLVISGYRRNEEKVELEPGRTRGTNAFQSFTESFPFAQAVESGLMTREFDGNTLTVTVPKKNLSTAYQPYKAKPARAHVDRPNFPANLPHVSEEPAAPQQTHAPSKGSRTLT